MLLAAMAKPATTKLFEAVQVGDIDAVSRALDEGGDPVGLVHKVSRIETSKARNVQSMHFHGFGSTTALRT